MIIGSRDIDSKGFSSAGFMPTALLADAVLSLVMHNSAKPIGSRLSLIEAI